jgi:hypothetical protein
MTAELIELASPAVAAAESLAVTGSSTTAVSPGTSPGGGRISLPVWSAVTDAHVELPETEIDAGRPTLMVLDGMTRALNVRIYVSEDGVAVSDSESGVFGAGHTLQDAVRDFRAALYDHLAVLAEDDALSPGLQQQLELLRSYLQTP